MDIRYKYNIINIIIIIIFLGGYHIVQHIWNAVVTEELPCRVEAGNPSFCSGCAEAVVGHVPQLFSTAIFTSLFAFLFPFPLDKIQEVNASPSLLSGNTYTLTSSHASLVIRVCRCGHKIWLEFNLACFCNSPIRQNFSFANNSCYMVYPYILFHF